MIPYFHSIPDVLAAIHYSSYFKLHVRWLRSLTRITYLSKLIGIPSLAACLKLELFRVYFHYQKRVQSDALGADALEETGSIATSDSVSVTGCLGAERSYTAILNTETSLTS